MNPSEENIITSCLQGDRNAQNQLYNLHKVKMFGICLRYADSREEAEDLLQEGFFQVFRDLKQFQGKGPLGAWIRKVMVNTILQHIRKHKKKKLYTIDIEDAQYYISLKSLKNTPTNSREEELLEMIQHLPIGYRTVFNLFVIDGYSHKEIAQKLGINENTSKSQLSRAKALLRKILHKRLNT